MGYFANGAEGADYEAQFCARCVHEYEADGVGCAVLEAHMMFNYDECNKPNSILHLLIPRTSDGLGNKQCRMFKPRPVRRTRPDFFAEDQAHPVADCAVDPVDET